MSDSEVQLDALQGRILAALDRIGDGVAGLTAPAAPVVDPAEFAALQQALEEERAASAQWQERNRVLKERLEAASGTMESALAEQRAALSQLDEDLQRLRKANEQLRESNRTLREANETGVGEPHLINRSMLAEIEALRATRAADRAEAEAIVSALAPLVANGGNS